MRVVFTYDVGDLERIKKIIKEYNPREIPQITSTINHIREDDSAKIRLTIEGDENHVINLRHLLEN